MNEKQKIEIDPDLYGIGWVTDREPTKEEIRDTTFQCLTASLRVFSLTWGDSSMAWRNAATIEAARKQRKAVVLAEDQEVITWRYDEPTEQDRWSACIIRWAMLTIPQPKKMTVEEFCKKWGANHDKYGIYTSKFQVFPKFYVGADLSVFADFDGDASELLKDVREVWG